MAGGGGLVQKGNGRVALPSGALGVILFHAVAGRGSRPLAALLSREQEEERPVAAQERDGNIWALPAE